MAQDERAPMTADEIRAPSASRCGSTARSPSSTTTPTGRSMFAREAERIRGALGGRALLVEHAGSTSVPGLAAKPVVDIVLAVPDSADEPACVPPLDAAGYVLRIREPEWYGHRVFKGPDTNVNLHVFSAGCPCGCSLSGTTSGATRATASCTSARSASSRSVTGSTSSTTPTPRRQSSRRSSPAPYERLTPSVTEPSQPSSRRVSVTRVSSPPLA